MQLLIKIENGRPVGFPVLADNLRLLIPELPDRYLLESDLVGTGYAGFFGSNPPENRNPTKKVVEITPTEQNADGEWIQSWEIVDRDDLTEEERSEMLQAYVQSEKQRSEREFAEAVQRHMDDRARKERYDDIRSAITYATSTHPKFGPEGIAFRDWRDAVWTKCYEILSEVESGIRSVPTPEELISELPVISLN